MKPELTVIKVGGKIVETPGTLGRLLDDFVRIPGPKILIHGGGRSATAVAAQLGIETRMVDGRRVTDAEMLRVVTMVYGGLVNKQIVAGLQARGCNAVGVAGADLDMVRAHRRPVKDVDYGFVGDVDRVNAAALNMLLDGGFVPVVAPLSHDGNGQLLNTNADTIASEVARAMAPTHRVRLMYCFEKPGVLSDAEDDSSVIPAITPGVFAELKNQGIVDGGMIPKLENAFAALHDGVAEVVITRADAIAEQSAGTHITD